MVAGLIMHVGKRDFLSAVAEPSSPRDSRGPPARRQLCLFVA